MNCYDCLSRQRTTVAVAVCTRCGAGLCLDHAHVAPEIVHESAGTGVTAHSRNARRFTCGICHEAEI
ncbi:hypothetical protein GCM10012287_06730 [Streptomyces daqingensis]|uniref:DUF2180 family protein n=1 Tax=Streptomyces daqingensis TaxID=1472640 RepID=A0ABQ2LUV8_9ACTN|nr:DUF2180 family protein [Streptomyces daqingensis]GGO43474.1 hypothetical protein GCM10012287_06730 [Streptomyces daqingensis]